MPRERIGSIVYHQYDSLSEAFHDLPEQAQALYMTIVSIRSAASSPVAILDLEALGSAFDISAYDAYVLLSHITGKVVRSEMPDGGKALTCLGITAQEFFSHIGDPVSVTLIVPMLEEHASLIEQFEDLAVPTAGGVE